MAIYRKDDTPEKRVIGIWPDKIKGSQTGIQIIDPIQSHYETFKDGIPAWKEIEPGKIAPRTQSEINADIIPRKKSGEEYFKYIMGGLSDAEKNKFLGVFDKYGSYGLLMRNGEIETAKLKIDEAVSNGDITTEEGDKIKTLTDQCTNN